ncbi:MAG: hypothetical protein GEU96_22375 [Propionibacteriales bacterium]|nr:hypothetical protein [Propionibacteriales bacterium]
MQYLLFIATDTDPERDDPESELTIEQWVAKHDASGTRVLGERLRPPEDATTVRKRAGKVLATDGPFAESREWIAGFDLIECADLDDAIAVAAEHPMARHGRIEVRPLWPDDE